MRTTIFSILFLLVINNGFGQGNNLVPVDSSNYVLIGDSLIDLYKSISNSNMSFSFEPDRVKHCPCLGETKFGLISFKSSAMLIRLNKCYFLYKDSVGYHLRVGLMTNKKDKNGKYIWKINSASIKEETANELVSAVKNIVFNAKIEKYNSIQEIPIVYDKTEYVFGDVENQNYAVTPTTNFSEPVKLIIKKSSKIVKRYLN